MTSIAWLASWYWLAIRQEARATWNGLPGPWYVKLALIGICTAIPGCLDEIALLAIVRLARRRSARACI